MICLCDTRPAGEDQTEIKKELSFHGDMSSEETKCIFVLNDAVFHSQIPYTQVHGDRRGKVRIERLLGRLCDRVLSVDTQICQP